MIRNYHTHTWRCGHARDTEREYVESAIAGGLKELGFSDHSPMPYPNGYISPVRMRVDQLEDYVSTVLALREEYKDDIDIHLGLEAEYFPDLFEELLELLSPYPFEYLLLGQHFLGNEQGAPYVGMPIRDETILQWYTWQCQEAILTGCFSYIAHPDVFYYAGDGASYEKWARELCRSAKQAQLPLEINFLGLGERRHYPNDAFWKVAGQEGNKVIFGADAHCRANVVRPDVEAEAQQIVGRYGLSLTDQVRLRRPSLETYRKNQGRLHPERIRGCSASQRQALENLRRAREDAKSR